MGTLAEYFEKNRPKPVWHIGDRVFGRWNKIPFVGTVGNDNMINEQEGPRVSIHLDLPILYNDKLHNIIFVKQKDIKRLVSMVEEEPLKLREPGSIPAKRTKQDDTRANKTVPKKSPRSPKKAT